MTMGSGLTVAAALYATSAAALVARAQWSDLRRRRKETGGVVSGQTTPPVTVLKPLCGPEIGLAENLRTFCRLDYPQFQLLFGVQDPADPAIEVVRRLQAEFPQAAIDLVIDAREHGANRKVSNLINLLPHVRHDWIVLSDSDVAVERDYLRRVTAPLADPTVGVVTCLYRGHPRGGWSARLGGQFVDQWFIPSVRVAGALGSTRFSFGATLALRRDTLEAVGGFGGLNDVLADDFWLGEFTRRLGLRTVLSPVMVRTDVTDPNPAVLWAHELRWMRTIRAAAPLGFAFTFITFTVPCLLLGVLLHPSSGVAAVALLGLGARIALHCVQPAARSWRARLAEVWLVPVRDFWSLALWAASHIGSRVRWRDQVLDAFAEPAAVEAGCERTARPQATP